MKWWKSEPSVFSFASLRLSVRPAALFHAHTLLDFLLFRYLSQTKAPRRKGEMVEISAFCPILCAFAPLRETNSPVSRPHAAGRLAVPVFISRKGAKAQR